MIFEQLFVNEEYIIFHYTKIALIDYVVINIEIVKRDIVNMICSILI